MKELYTVEEAAIRVKVSQYWIRELLKQRRLEGFKLGGNGRWRIPAESLMKYLYGSSQVAAS